MMGGNSPREYILVLFVGIFGVAFLSLVSAYLY